MNTLSGFLILSELRRGKLLECLTCVQNAPSTRFDSSTSGLICGPVKGASGEMWGVLVVAEPLSGNAFDEESVETFRSVFVYTIFVENMVLAEQAVWFVLAIVYWKILGR